MSDKLLASTYLPEQTKPRSVYIHVPFCRHRCGYCNFTLVAGRDYLVDRFLDSLEIEISWLEEIFEVDTVFFGGGTPSHLSPKNLARLNEIVHSRFVFSKNCEVTAECNPSDLTSSCASTLAECGVNRVSLGVQSLNANKLKVLERDHSSSIVAQSVENARSFADSVSLDLIFAAPGESLDQWQLDLVQAIALQPDHFSTYELTYEKGTSFWSRRMRKELSSTEEDLKCLMYERAIDTLANHGYAQYEVSSFAKTGHQCRHNNVYWAGVPYFAFGPGASRYIDGIRETNHQSTTRYLRLVETGQSPVSDSEQLEPQSMARELLAIGLRRTSGVNFEQFRIQTGFDAKDLISNIKPTLRDGGLVGIDSSRIWLTRKGLLVCDWIASEILNGQRQF